MKSFKEILKDALIINGKVDIRNLKGRVINWPEVGEPDAFDDDEESMEHLDLENWEIISISDNNMVMCAGGDWQEPLTFTLTAENGLLWADKITEGYEEGLSEKEILDFFK